MNDTITEVAALTPVAAMLVIAAVASTVITQLAKRPGATRRQTQTMALTVSTVLGAIAYVISGVAVGVPASVVDVVSSVVVFIAGVVLMARAIYAVLGYAVTDGTAPVGKRARRDGTYSSRGEVGDGDHLPQ